MTKELVQELGGKAEAEEQAQLPSSVDFMLLGTCDLNCPFCFGPRHTMSAMKTETAINIIYKVAERGTKKVVFTGGEPTLMGDLPKILAEAKRQKLTTVLSTNGLKLTREKELLAQIAPHLDWIALSLDGDTPEANSRMRVGHNPNAGNEHFEATLGLIPRIRSEHPLLKIKLGTVISQANAPYISGIPDLLRSRNALPDTWKLYQISPSTYGSDNYSWLKISDEEYESTYRRASEEATRVRIPNVVRHTNEERPGKHMFIDPAANVLVVDRSTNDYHSIGNAQGGFDKIVDCWQNYVDQDILSSNFELDRKSVV